MRTDNTKLRIGASEKTWCKRCNATAAMCRALHERHATRDYHAARLKGGDQPEITMSEKIHIPQPISNIPTKRLSRVLAGINFSTAT